MSEHAFPWPQDRIARYTAYRVDEAPGIDGDLSKPCWKAAPQSKRFVDLISGESSAYDTRIAVLWDDDNLYVGFWVEEPDVAASLTERDSLIYNDNDVEVFIAGPDCYYEFEINAFGTVYEVFFVWDDVYESGGFAADPELSRDLASTRPFNGVGYTSHPRGLRTGCWGWDYPGMQSAVAIQGTINDDSDRDQGWTVELAFPWAGMAPIAGDRPLPPVDGDEWRISFSRFNQYKKSDSDSSGWTMSAHGVWDSHIPELFPFVSFSNRDVTNQEG